MILCMFMIYLRISYLLMYLCGRTGKCTRNKLWNGIVLKYLKVNKRIAKGKGNEKGQEKEYLLSEKEIKEMRKEKQKGITKG